MTANRVPQYRRARPRFLVLALFVAAVSSCAAWASQTRSSVTFDEITISNDVRMINGRAFVPLADMAKGMDLGITRMGDEYRLARAYGPQIGRNVAGRIGTAVSSGAWTFRVVSADRLAVYSDQFGSGDAPIPLQRTDDILLVVRCQLKNRSNQMRDVYFDATSAGNTALVDEAGHAYPPRAVDSRNSNHSSSRLIPGALHEFALVFSVPKDTRMKSLSYTANASDDDAKAEFRVALAP